MKLIFRPVLAAVALTLSLHADSSFDNTDKFAWSGNTGWISFRHDQPSSPEGIVLSESYLSGLAYAANTGWINFGDGSPTNGHSYSNIKSDHGVNHDGSGNLSGYAWSANTGWINFDWATNSDPDRPRVDLFTGDFFGYAWGTNTGWINLATGILTAQSMNCPDTDSDDISDSWEMKHFGNLTTANATSDNDGDGASDVDEYAADTDPDDESSFLRIVSHNYNGTHTTAQIEFSSTPTRHYRIEYTNQLDTAGPWINSTHGTFAASAGATTTKVVVFAKTTQSRSFFRAISIRPLNVSP